MDQRVQGTGDLRGVRVLERIRELGGRDTRKRGREGLGAFGGSLAHLLPLRRGQPLIVFIRGAQTVRQPEKLLVTHRG